MSILDRHMHMPPKDPHRLVALNSTHVRCIDCQQTLDLGNLGNARSSVAGSTSSTFSPLNLSDDRSCPQHVGQHAGACGLCRAETLEAPVRSLAVVKGSDPTQISEWRKARERFGSKKGQAS